MYIALYFVLAALLVFLSIKLSDFVDLLNKKTKLSGALLGGILLAAVTSLPELFTSLTGTLWNQDNQMVLGNIMGSDFFDIIIFGVVYFLFFRKFSEGKVGKNHYFTILFTALMVAAISIGAFVFRKNGWTIGYFNPMSLVIIAIYVISILTTPATEEKEKEEVDNCKLTVKQIWILFIVCSILLIGASIAITRVVEKVKVQLNMDAAAAGSFFLGIATSIPEVTATIALCHKKNFDAAYGDIFGSCLFNIIILALADALSFAKGSESVYTVNSNSLMLIIGTLFALLIALLSIIFIRSKKFKNSVGSRIILYIFGFLLIASYAVYVVVSLTTQATPII